jgi:hypothetical protein
MLPGTMIGRSEIPRWFFLCNASAGDRQRDRAEVLFHIGHHGWSSSTRR